MRIVVIGGAGFIGSAVCRSLVARGSATVLNIDKLTHASSLASLEPVARSPRYSFRRADICDRERMTALLQAFAPDAIVHAAAEHHADARIGGAAAAVETNIVGTWRLLEAAREHWSGLPEQRRARFRFLSVSSIDASASPAIASRAAADEMVLAWHKSYGLPTIVSKAADTFGPYQFPGETVPAAILAALEGQAAPASGAPTSARGWLYIEDHVRALELMLENGTPGASYTVAGKSRLASAAIAMRIAALVERHASHRGQPPRSIAGAGQMREPAVPMPVLDTSRLEQDTGWRASETLDSGLSKTVRWYAANAAWWRPLSAAQSAGDVHNLLRIA